MSSAAQRLLGVHGSGLFALSARRKALEPGARFEEGLKPQEQIVRASADLSALLDRLCA
ncbi:hypothetical protein ACIA8I_23415 [Streptomyces rishiriensis]|uniref:hypothetical protein n=1 Tax=Streptomyces rishiriensis TaxID=68264 RepID=UPI00379E2B52